MLKLQYVQKKFKSFFCPQKVKKTPSKVAQKNSYPLFFLTAWDTQAAKTEGFMFQNVAYRPTVYKTGVFGNVMFAPTAWQWHQHGWPS